MYAWVGRTRFTLVIKVRDECSVVCACPPPTQHYTAFLTAMDCDVGFISAVIQLVKAPTLMGRGLSAPVMVRLSMPGGRVADSTGADIFFVRLVRQREGREGS